MASEYYPPSGLAIAIYGMISAMGGLLWALSWSPAWHSGDAVDTIFGFLGMPVDATLLVSSAGLLMLLPWSRKWMLRWAIAATIWATVYLLAQLIWPPQVNLADLLPPDYKNEVSQLDPNTAQMIVSIMGTIKWIGWLSTLSLSLWVLWAMTRPMATIFLDEHGTSEAKIPKMPSFGRKN